MSVRKVVVSLELFSHLITGKFHQFTTDLPEDAKVVDVYADWMNVGRPNSIILLIESETYPVIPQRQLIPEIQVTMKFK